MTAINRRFINEIDSLNSPIEMVKPSRQRWVKNFDKDSFILSDYSDTNVIFAAIIDKYVIPITISINSKGNRYGSPYPFRPPKINVGIYEYKSLLHINKFALDILKIKCMCCSTLLCGHNWKPQNTIVDLLTEVKKNMEIKLRGVEIYHTVKIVDKYLGDAFRCLPILEFL